jgi:Uncharacterized conserved protein (COG2071)
MRWQDKRDVRVSLRTRDLVVVSWPIAWEDARRLLPAGLEPGTVDGRYLISLVAMRHEGAGRYRQLNVRTYVEHEGEEAVYFLITRVTLAGLVGALMGAPIAPSRIAVGRGLVEAPGLGVSLRYRIGDESDPGPIGRHELGIYGRSRLKAFRISRGPAVWRRGELEEPVRADPLVVYGLQPSDEAEVLYAEQAPLVLEARPRPLRLLARNGKIEGP